MIGRLQKFILNFLFLLIILLLSSPLWARTRIQGWCQQGGQTVAVSGIISTTTVQQSYKTCTINIYYPGTTTPVTLYSTESGTLLANPFTNQNTTTGQWFAFVDVPDVDVKFSATGLATYTIGNYIISPTAYLTGFGAACDGSTNDSTAFTTANTALTTSGGNLVIPAGRTCVVGSVSIAANVNLVPESGGMLSITSAGTATFASGSAFTAPPEQVFTGAGNVVISSGANIPFVYPQWWGAKGDASTDNSASLQAAITAAPRRSTILIPAGTYNFGTTLSLLNARGITLQGASECNQGSSTCATTLIYTGSSGNGWNLDGANGVTFKNLSLSYNNASYTGNFISLPQSAGTSDTAFIHFDGDFIGGASGTSKSAASCILIGNDTENVTIEHSFLTNCVNPILGNSTAINSIHVNGNWMDQRGSYGVVYCGNTWDISGNIFEPTAGAHTPNDAIQVCSSGATAIAMNGNNILDGETTGQTALMIALTNGSGVTTSAEIRHNLIEGGLTGVTCGASVGVEITDNSFQSVTNGVDLSGAGGCSNFTVKDNTYLFVSNANKTINFNAATSGSAILSDGVKMYFRLPFANGQVPAMWIDANGIVNVGSDTSGVAVAVSSGTSGLIYCSSGGNCIMGDATTSVSPDTNARLRMYQITSNGPFMRWDSADFTFYTGMTHDDGVFRVNTGGLSGADHFSVATNQAQATIDPLNYISSETGSNNAIAGTFSSPLTPPALTAGLTVRVVLAHTLQAGANTFNYNATGAVAIKSHISPSSNIGTAYSTTGAIIELTYTGSAWLDMSQ